MSNKFFVISRQSAMSRSCVSFRAFFAAQAFVLATGIAGSAFAAPENRTLASDNNNSLIDIYDLEDFEAIRDDPEGTQIYGLTAGCPGNVCTGYELRVDLDFDDLADPFWDPIDELECTFDGRGHVIRNLAVHDFEFGPALEPLSRNSVPKGLFSFLNGAVVRNLRFEDVILDEVGDYAGVLAGFAQNSSLIERVTIVRASVDGGTHDALGGLVGVCQDSDIVESVVDVEITASGHVGGLVGYSQDCLLARDFVHGRVTSSRYHNIVGGLAGQVDSGRIENSYVTGSVGEAHVFGGLIGTTGGSPEIVNSYVAAAVIGIASGGGGLMGLGDATFTSTFHATDATGYENAITGVDAGTGVLLADLRCPTAAGDPNCKGGTMFTGWGSALNLDSQPAWDFGSGQQLPALVINNVVYRDSDGDGVLDTDDDFPNRWEASLDSDGDGAIDRWKEGCDEDCRASSDLVLDQFPDDADATLDLDLDGYPEAWNPSCDPSCQAASNLTLDPYPNDSDNDGCPDTTGPGTSSCPATGDPDDNNDNSEDIDEDSDGLIDIFSLEDLLVVDYDPSGASKRESGILIEPGKIPLEDTSGCPPRIVRGVLARECNGYELLADLNMDTNNDGVLDAGDTYWRNGLGWEPLGQLSDDPRAAFQTNFEGNGHTIANVLTSASYSAGLFGGIRGANIRNLGIIGTNGQGSAYAVGGLVGSSQNSTITNCYSRAGALATDYAGGLVGLAEGTHIVGSFAVAQAAGYGSDACTAGGLVASLLLDSSVTASFAAGYVSNICGGSGVIAAGGLVGYVDETSSVSASYSIGPVDGGSTGFGGLVGLSEGSVTASYWATDTSTRSSSAGGALGAIVDELECPTDADDTSCVSGVSLYTGWDAFAQAGAPYWDFGTASELPGLCIAGQLHRTDAVGFLQAPTDCACTASEVELVTNQGFESGTSGWSGFASNLSSSTAQAHTGSRSLRVAGRSNNWSGADYPLLNIAERGETLSTSLWARTEGVASASVKLTVRYACQGGDTDYILVGETTATNGAWAKLSGDVQIPDCQLTQLIAYVEGPPPGVAFYVDDVTFAATDLSCSGGSTEGIYGDYTVYTDWGTGYCLEVVIHNGTSQATSNWSAQIDLNGTMIDPGNHWNVNLSGYTGTVTLSSAQSWGQVIQPGGNTYSLGFCATRPPGNSSLPAEPVVTASF